MTVQQCPTCGSQVRVVGTTTLHYEPVANEEIARLREALAFYAERGNWAITTTGVYNILALHSSVLNDRGKRARDVLAALEGK